STPSWSSSSSSSNSSCSPSTTATGPGSWPHDLVEPGERAGVEEGARARLAVVARALGRGEGAELVRAAQRVGQLRRRCADVVALGVGDVRGAGDLPGVPRVRVVLQRVEVGQRGGGAVYEHAAPQGPARRGLGGELLRQPPRHEPGPTLPGPQTSG